MKGFPMIAYYTSKRDGSKTAFLKCGPQRKSESFRKFVKQIHF